MPDAIDNLVQDINQNNTSVDEFPGYPGYKLGDLVPGMAGVRIGDTDFYGTDAYGQQAPYNWRTGVFEFAAPPTTPANPDSQFENYLAGIKDLQAPVSSPSKPYTPAFTPMAAPPAVRVTTPTQFGPVTASGYAQPPVDPMSYYSNPSTASLSNPSTLGGGSEIDYNIPDNPTVRINEGSTDEQDARVYTPRNQEQYIKGENVLVSPWQAGGTVGVEYLDPEQVAAMTAGQKPSSLPEEFITRGETVKIPGRGLPNFEAVGKNEDGIVYLDTVTRKVFFPGDPDYPGVSDLTGNPDLKSPSTLTKGTGTSVGATEPTTASEGGFDNTGGNVTVGPGNVTAGPGGTTNVTPGYKEPEKGPGINPFIDSPWKIATGSGVNMDYIDPSTGKEFPADQDGNKWNFRTGEWDMAKPPGKDTGTTTTPPAGGGTGTGGTTTTPPGTGTGTTPPPGGGTSPGGGTTTTPGGGVRPGTGTGTGTYTGTPLPPREPVTPLVRRETVIPTKGTKEVPLPDRQADPFAKLYADLLANAQQQKDQYRYINYDPDQIMNAAMSGFRRRGAMRSLQGY